MNVKITKTVRDDGLLAGFIYDLPAKQAKKLIDLQVAIEYVGDVVDVTSLGDMQPVFIEGVADDDRQNNAQ